MSARDMQKNLLLECRTGKKDGNVFLAKIPGKRYTFGTLNPEEVDAVEGEEFIPCRGYRSGLISPSHCTIRVDDQGQFWIQDYNHNSYANGKWTFSFYETFVNSERVEASESRLLKSGDIISLGAPETDWAGSGHAPHPIYRVMEEGIRAGPQIEVKANYAPEESPFDNGLFIQEGAVKINCPQIDVKENEDGPKEVALAESPFDNGLILAKIMSYLPASDLKNARLVNKTWRGEASILLEKKGQVWFEFGAYNFNQKYSKRVVRYLKEMTGLKMQNLHICLNSCKGKSNPSQPQPLQQNSSRNLLEKMLDDIKNLLKSKNFLHLSLFFYIKEALDFLPFQLIFEELGEKLVGLKLGGGLVTYLPEKIPSFPLMKNLRKFSFNGGSGRDVNWKRLISHITPLFAENLEHLEVDGYSHLVDVYLPEVLKEETPKLKEIVLPGKSSAKVLSLLLKLKTPLTLLKIEYVGEDCSALGRLLLKNSQSLQHLSLSLRGSSDTDTEFPSFFPKLEELELQYDKSTRISCEMGSFLDYKEDLPSLRRFKIVASSQAIRDLDWGEEEADPVFNFFFNGNGAERRCETVTSLCVNEKARQCQWRLDRIKETFPNAALNYHYY